MNHIRRVTKNATTVKGNQWGQDETTITDCCGLSVTYSGAVLCCRGCYREVVHQDEVSAYLAARGAK